MSGGLTTGGQNKNHCVWFFQDLIRKGVYSRIDYKFLVVGHTYGPADRCFGTIEKYLMRIENECIHTTGVVSACERLGCKCKF